MCVCVCVHERHTMHTHRMMIVCGHVFGFRIPDLGSQDWSLRGLRTLFEDPPLTANPEGGIVHVCVCIAPCTASQTREWVVCAPWEQYVVN